MAWEYSTYTMKVYRICNREMELSNRNRGEQEKTKATHWLSKRWSGGTGS